MDCNKEEALRARTLAEKKLQSKDFPGARKIALKAQQLYPELENIAQLLMVCDVHCSAEKKLFGDEMDWYGILQLEQAADEASIKKQYRKFALYLHPDKNKFSGAEAAFKLIGEAQRVLLDREKRSMHDMKRHVPAPRASARASYNRQPSAPYRPPQKANWSPNVVYQNSTGDNLSGFKAQQPQQPAQPGFANERRTFWTVCHFCSVKYQYYIELINKPLPCSNPNCGRTFLACEMNIGGAFPASRTYTPTVQHQKVFPTQGASKVEVGRKGTSTPENGRPDVFRKTEIRPERVNKKRHRRQVVESSESYDSSSSSESDADSVIGEDVNFQGVQDFGHSGKQSVRRSTRQKQQVSYKENLSDDEDTNPAKRSKGASPSSSTEEDFENVLGGETSDLDGKEGLATNLNEDKEGGKHTENGCSGGNPLNDDSRSESCMKDTKDPEVYSYPDPDFNDFDKERTEGCFESGQVWAVYDTLDAMPRFYALIRRVYPGGFRLRITWLEPDPDDEKEINWRKESLPVSCGKFKHGESQNTKDRPMFSHVVFYEKGSDKQTCKIYPQRGETWALFKNWDINWHSDPDNPRKYEFDIVEILSVYAEGSGLSVAYLGKVKGFASLFSRKAKNGISSFQIGPDELYRFSHRVPSYRMTGDEREGVPKGSFELDPASIPMNLEEFVPSEDPEMSTNGSHCEALHSCVPEEVKTEMGSEENSGQSDLKEVCTGRKKCSSVKHKENSSASAPLPSEVFEVPDPEFHNFDDAKSPENFRVGQVWALYSDEEGLPKYYGRIMTVLSEPEFKLQLRWIAVFLLPDNVIKWQDDRMPISCGKFRLERGRRPQFYTSTASFSHCVKVELGDDRKTETFNIFPRKDEVWALYKNWCPEMKFSELGKCEFEVVEVIEENDLGIKVVALEHVMGFNSVFKPQARGDLRVTIEIPWVELMRFSHQVPAFQLTEERNGSLRGFWEIDTAALPSRFFSLS